MIKKKDPVRQKAQRQMSRDWGRLAKQNKIPDDVISRVKQRQKGAC